MAAFDRNDVSVADALVHLTGALDRERLLALRVAGTRAAGREAREKVAPLGSAVLLDAFVGEPLTKAGAHDEALAVRLEALARTPRWDSALAARVLARTSENLRALGRLDDALALSARALRFMPAEPRVVATHAAALEAAGSAADAAAYRAWLFDVGVGKTVLPGEVGAAERDATAYAPDLGALEPLDDEGVARHLAMTYVDLGLVNHMLQGRRHAMACLRHGVPRAALGTLEGYAGGTPNATDAGRWIGWPVGATDYVATDALLALVEARLAGTKVERAAKDLGHRLAGKRADAVEALAKAGRADLAREGLFDRVAYVRYRAARALPDDPIVQRVRAVEATLDPSVRCFSSETVPDGIDVSLAHHGGTRFRQGRAEIAYPTATIDPASVDLHAPHVEAASSARSKCKVCKVAIAAGELRLRVRHKHFPVETHYTHLRCAASGKHGPLLGSSKLERDDGPLLRVALRRTRLEVPDRAALLAAMAG